MVDSLIHPLLAIIQTTVAEHYELDNPPEMVVSMRCLHKVHLNFPDVITTELQHMACLERIKEKCIEEVDVPEGLKIDWELLLDKPHGSLRLLGSKKAPWQDKDPPWVGVRQKSYWVVEYKDGKWEPQRTTLGLLRKCSIRMTAEQQAEYEQSPRFLSTIFEDVQMYKDNALRKREERMKRKTAKQLETMAAAESSEVASPMEEGVSGQQVHTESMPVPVLADVCPSHEDEEGGGLEVKGIAQGTFSPEAMEVGHPMGVSSPEGDGATQSQGGAGDPFRGPGAEVGDEDSPSLHQVYGSSCPDVSSSSSSELNDDVMGLSKLVSDGSGSMPTP